MKVLVINQCSTNKGDRAVAFFVLRELARNDVDQITLSASIPQRWKDWPDFPDKPVRCIPWGWDTSRRRGVGLIGKVVHLAILKFRRRFVFPLVRNAFLRGRRPWYLPFLINKQYLEAVQQADLVLSTGGHHVTTLAAGHAATPQMFDMMVPLLYGKPLVLWSQSIGTFAFKCSKNKAMVQKILSDAKQVFVRDAVSQEDIQNLGVSTDHVVQTVESVFGLADVVKVRTRPSDRPLVMGLSVWTGRRVAAQGYDNYAREFVPLVNHALRAGYKVRFFSMELGGADIPCLKAIIQQAGRKDECEIVETVLSTVDHINAVEQCRVFVGHKTHSVVFSLVAATPLIAIAYHNKTRDFMAQFGLGKYCIPDEQLSGARLVELFDEVNGDLDVIQKTEEEMTLEVCKRVGEDFAMMIDKVRAGLNSAL